MNKMNIKGKGFGVDNLGNGTLKKEVHDVNSGLGYPKNNFYNVSITDNVYNQRGKFQKKTLFENRKTNNTLEKKFNKSLNFAVNNKKSYANFINPTKLKEFVNVKAFENETNANKVLEFLKLLEEIELINRSPDKSNATYTTPFTVAPDVNNTTVEIMFQYSKKFKKIRSKRKKNKVLVQENSNKV